MFTHRLLVTGLLVLALLAPAGAASLDRPAALVEAPAPPNSPATPGDEYWATGFHLPGMNDTVQALVAGPDGALYAGGMFTTAGSVVANRIARWDGTQWHSLGNGMTGGYYAGVKALVFGHDGSLYVGGEFSTAGGVTANSIARWDGAHWHPLGSGMSGAYNPYVSALVVGPDGSLYAGGLFTTAGGVTTNNIARWDAATSSWHPLGSGMDIYGIVYALAFGPDGSLYAGGRFTTAGGVAASGIARWDAATSSWHPLGSGISGGDYRYVYALVFGHDGSLYVGGEFTTAGGVAANSIARWDTATSSWHPLGSGMSREDAYVSALVFGPDGSLYAGGWFTEAGGIVANSIARWDAGNSSWHPLGSGVPGRRYFAWVSTLAYGPDGSLYAGGNFTAAGGVAANNIARWDAATSSWHPLGSGSGLNHVVRALAFGPDGSLYAGGSFTTAGGTAANGIARWDTAISSWHPLGSGMSGGDYTTYVFALAFGPDGSLYAGGHFDTAGGAAANYIARWDAATSSWHPLGSGMSGGDYTTYVSALAFGPDGSLYAGGNFTTAGGVVANYIARWDGIQWHPLGSGMSDKVYDLAFGPDGSLYAGGHFRTAGGVTANSIARWDGTHWHPLGSGMSDAYNTYVYDLAFGPDGSLYAGGNFGTAGGVAANNIARWDGSQWHPLGGGMIGGYDPWVSALAFGSDGSLYAGGRFTTAGGVAANGIARWDTATSSWHSLGSGMGGSDPCVYILAMGSDGSLYAGGSFATAGGKLSSHIALWTGAILRPAIWFPVVLLEQ